LEEFGQLGESGENSHDENYVEHVAGDEDLFNESRKTAVADPENSRGERK
jgi:hypothetical protein